tara:strand:- start:5365 stop:5766 length:402 start_codon:yes stop_codon:yes gene_type:complete
MKLPSSVEKKKMTPYKVLVVDDEENIRGPICIALDKLSKGKYQTVEATNGLEGLEAMRQGRYDALLTDVRMPIMDGVEMINQAISEDICPPKVLVMTGNGFEYVKRLREEGLEVITKPFSLRDPIQKLDRLLL